MPLRISLPFNVYYGENEEAARFLVENTELRKYKPPIERIKANTDKEFVENPDSIQKILYLDQPDLIVTYGYPEVTVLGVELCAEAPTGHDIFQRTARVVASAEFGTPFAFVFPEKKWVEREKANRWDTYNPLPLRALLQISRIHKTPILSFFWSADQMKGDPKQGYLICDSKYPNLPSRKDPEMEQMIQFVNLVIEYVVSRKNYSDMMFDPLILGREERMWRDYSDRVGTKEWSPLTTCKKLETKDLKDFVRKQTGRSVALPAHVEARKETVIYDVDSKSFRSDLYAGNLAVIDYLHCCNVSTIRYRYRNLVMNFAQVPFKDIAEKYQRFYDHDCPFRSGYKEVDRYLNLHLREGCRFTKQKELRTFCFLSDVLVFADNLLY